MCSNVTTESYCGGEGRLVAAELAVLVLVNTSPSSGVPGGGGFVSSSESLLDSVDLLR